MGGPDDHADGELTDARLDALVLDAVARRMHSYETLVRTGPVNLPPGARPGRARLEASVARLDAEGYLDWFKEDTWLAASLAGRNHNIDLQHIDLRREAPILLDEPAAADGPAAHPQAADDAETGRRF